MKLMQTLFPHFVPQSIQREDSKDGYPARMTIFKRAYMENRLFNLCVAPDVGHIYLYMHGCYTYYYYVPESTIKRIMRLMRSFKPATQVGRLDSFGALELLTSLVEPGEIPFEEDYSRYFVNADKETREKADSSISYGWDFHFERRIINYRNNQYILNWEAHNNWFMPHFLWFDNDQNFKSTMIDYLSYCSQFSPDFKWNVITRVHPTSNREMSFVEIKYPEIFLDIAEPYETADLSHLRFN